MSISNTTCLYTLHVRYVKIYVLYTDKLCYLDILKDMRESRVEIIQS